MKKLAKIKKERSLANRILGKVIATVLGFIAIMLVRWYCIETFVPAPTEFVGIVQTGRAMAIHAAYSNWILIAALAYPIVCFGIDAVCAIGEYVLKKRA